MLFLGPAKASLSPVSHLNPAERSCEVIITANGFTHITWAGALLQHTPAAHTHGSFFSQCIVQICNAYYSIYIFNYLTSLMFSNLGSLSCAPAHLSHTTGVLLCYCLSILYSTCSKSMWDYQKSEGRHDRL